MGHDDDETITAEIRRYAVAVTMTHDAVHS